MYALVNKLKDRKQQKYAVRIRNESNKTHKNLKRTTQRFANDAITPEGREFQFTDPVSMNIITVSERRGAKQNLAKYFVKEFVPPVNGGADRIRMWELETVVNTISTAVSNQKGVPSPINPSIYNGVTLTSLSQLKNVIRNALTSGEIIDWHSPVDNVLRNICGRKGAQLLTSQETRL